MSLILDLIAIIFIIGGTLFSIVGVLGYVRLPDVYSRLHATGKVGVFGVVLLLFGTFAATPSGWSRALVLLVFLLLTGPVSAHALSSAAYRLGLPMKDSVRDDLAENRTVAPAPTAAVEPAETS
jgi:multicomponent Na+:H+ antiporter subunit G